MTADKQPETLRQADLLEIYGSTDLARQAADELRRLHAENAELLEALKTVTKHLDVVSSNTTDLEVVWAAEKVISKATGEMK